MNNSVVRVAVVCLLSGLIAVPALAKKDQPAAKSTPHIQLASSNVENGNVASEPVRVADGPSPTPWCPPKSPNCTGVRVPEDVQSPSVVAEGGNPVPWPKPGTGSPTGEKSNLVMAEGGNPVPWPKPGTGSPTGEKSNLVMAEGGNPVPWPKTVLELA